MRLEGPGSADPGPLLFCLSHRRQPISAWRAPPRAVPEAIAYRGWQRSSSRTISSLAGGPPTTCLPPLSVTYGPPCA